MAAGQTVLDGTITSGPPTVTDTTFPSSVNTVTLRTAPWPKGYNCNTGTKLRTVNSPGAFVTLDGVGTNHDVPAADFLYLRCDNEVLLRITQRMGAGPATQVATFYHVGPLVKQSSTTNPIVLVEVQGSATIEYQAEGQ